MTPKEVLNLLYQLNVGIITEYEFVGKIETTVINRLLDDIESKGKVFVIGSYCVSKLPSKSELKIKVERHGDFYNMEVLNDKHSKADNLNTVLKNIQKRQSLKFTEEELAKLERAFLLKDWKKDWKNDWYNRDVNKNTAFELLEIWGNRWPEFEENRDVHTEHCCIIHGCKYGYDSGEVCSVTEEIKVQTSLCYWCYEELNGRF